MAISISRKAGLALAVMLLAVAPASSGTRAATCPAGPFVVSAGDAFQRAASNGSADAFAVAVSRYTDMQLIANFALGSYRSALPASRQGEYFALARRFMGAFMANHSRDFRSGNLQVVDCNGNTVSARTNSGQRLVFRLEQAGGGYRIRDVNVQSIWLAQQMRSTIVGTIRNGDGDINAVFSYLRRY